jgi:hypothetical protein
MSDTGTRFVAEESGPSLQHHPAVLLTQPQGRAHVLDDFINEFKTARKTYHKRAIWAERWARGEVAWRDD